MVTLDYTRGAGYIQLTHEASHRAFLRSIKNSYSGNDTASYIANNFPVEASAWYWAKSTNTGKGTLNAYVAEYGAGENIFLVSQYYVNGWPDGIKYPNFNNDIAAVRAGGKYTFEKTHGKTTALIINGNEYPVPNGWDDRLTKYQAAYDIFNK